MTDKRTEIAEILAGHAGSKAFLSDGSEFGHIREVWFGYADALINNLPELNRHRLKMPLAWPIATHNPQTGEEWPLCIRHKGAPVIGGVCGRCTMRGDDW